MGNNNPTRACYVRVNLNPNTLAPTEPKAWWVLRPSGASTAEEGTKVPWSSGYLTELSPRRRTDRNRQGLREVV